MIINKPTSAAEHHTAKQCSKNGRRKPWKHLRISNLSWNMECKIQYIKVQDLIFGVIFAFELCKFYIYISLLIYMSDAFHSNEKSCENQI